MKLRYFLPAVFVVSMIATTLSQPGWAQTPAGHEQTTPSYQDDKGDATGVPLGPISHGGETPLAPASPGVSPPITTIQACDFDNNSAENGGYLFIPPDPIAAAGPSHLVNVVNAMIEWYDKSSGVRQHRDALRDFFGPTPLGTFAFDPKVVYDQHAGRFVVVALERTSSPQDSYILVAVSKDSDPNNGWWYHSIPSKLTIGTTATWADYPGLAVDDKAVYITANMFSFAGSYVSMRLWIIDKGLAGGFYGGGAAGVAVHDPYGAIGYGGYESTSQPTHMFGTPPTGQSGNPLGTWLVAYSGWTNGGPGGAEYLFLIEVDDPLGTGGGPYFYQQWRSIGDVEDIGGTYDWPALPDAPQLGSSSLIEVNDRRCLNAVWRDNKLYASTTINPNSGPDAGHTTAHWFEMGTASPAAVTLDDQGDAGAEDLGSDTYTYFPSVMVNQAGDMAIGFSASNSSIYASACYTGREPTDPAGTVQGTNVYCAGTDWYYRTFGGSRNRWGDYSGLSVCPSDELTFWAYNERAITRGTVMSGEDGRWGTCYASFQITAPPPTAQCLYVSSPSGNDLTGDGALGNPYKTIAHALGLAASGDTVKVLPGTHSPWVLHNEEPFPLNMVNGVVLMSTGGPAVTILDAVRESRVMEGAGLDNTTKIDGFTIRRGRAQADTHPDVDDGAGMFFTGSSLIISDCVFESNDADDRGGALCFKDDCEPHVNSCVFYDNRASTGGGVYAELNCNLDLNNCTLSDNIAHGTSGGGVALEDNSSTRLDNTIIAYSHGLSAQAVECDGTSSATAACSDMYNNQGGDWVGCLAGQGAGTNFSADPKFCDRPGRDFHIWISSPCAPGFHPNGQACGLIGALPVNCSSPVPVALAGFAATPTEEGILLEWSSTSLSDVAAFKVHRSSDGRDGFYALLSDKPVTGEGVGGLQFSYHDANVIPGTLYHYKLETIESGASGVTFGPYPAVATGRAYQYFLGQNIPNPFTRGAGTTIRYSVPVAQDVEIRILDVAGRLIRTITQNASVGLNQASWDGADKNGRDVSSGVYFYQIRAGIFSSEKKMLLVE